MKILPKSPSKTIRTTSDGRTVIVQSPSKQQIVIRGGQGGSRLVETESNLIIKLKDKEILYLAGML